MASGIFFSGRLTHVPGAYLKVDASGLESVGLGASGIIAVLGTAVGGVPASALVKPEDFPRYSGPDAMNKAFRSGDLYEVGDMLFAPAKDDAIPGGAQQVIVMKTNPSTQSTGSLLASAAPVVDITSRDYGAFTSQINVEVATGTNKGKALTIAFEDVVETVDDLGGDALFTLEYVPGTYGYDTATGAVNDAGDLTVSATRAAVGKSADLTTNSGNAAVEVAEAGVTDTSVTITTKVGNVVTFTNFTGVTPAMAGKIAVVSGAASSGNNGTFSSGLTYISSTSFSLINAAGVASDANSGSITVVIKDTPVVVTVYGLVSGVATKEVITTSGNSTVTGTTVWDASGVLGVTCDVAPAVGALTVKIAPGGSTIFTVAVGTVAMGALICENCFVATGHALSLALSGSGTPVVAVFGKNNASADIQEAVTMTGAVPVLTTLTTWAQIDVIALAYVSNARTFTASVTAAKTLASERAALSLVKTYFDARQNIVASVAYGFVFAYGTGNTGFLMADLDVLTGVNLESVDGEFTADLSTIVEWINDNSLLVTAKVHTGAAAVPDNTSAPMYLTGGAEGSASFSDYQNALNLLKQVRVNSVLDLSGDPAVAAAVDAHCAYMGGIGRSERDGAVGILNDAMTDVETKSKIKTKILDINSRHIRACAQTITRFNRAGVKTTFLPQFQAALALGAQAGAATPGTSLTHKFFNALEVGQHSSWNPKVDADEMIQAGLWFMELEDGKGRRNVRNVTTHLSSDNLAFVEASVNNALNFAALTFRTDMEKGVAVDDFDGSSTAALALATGSLNRLVAAKVIKGWRSLQFNQLLDVMETSVEMAVKVPTNFIPITVHVIDPAVLAAAA